jgi:hypothetical protein
MRKLILFILIAALFTGCTTETIVEETGEENVAEIDGLLAKYAPVEISRNLDGLTDLEKAVVDKMIAASEIIDGVYWLQASTDGMEIRNKLAANNDDLSAKKLHFLEINKFAYDRLDANKPFLGEKQLPTTGVFWPTDITSEEIEAYVATYPEEKEAIYSLYTVVRRDGNKLKTILYSELYLAELTKAAALLREAAELTDDQNLAIYLNLVARGLLSDDYLASDMAWMDLDGKLDLVIGPIEVYEDQLMNLKSAFEAYVLVKDQAASDELASYIDNMDAMQQALPIEAKYKQREVRLGSSVGVFTQIYGSGQSEAGGKTIAISLPNDPRVRESKGSRKVMLRNALDAKFEKILKPIAEIMMASEQIELVSRDMFFSNVLLHEVSHSLGNDFVLDVDGNATEISIDEMLKETSTILEECKADIGGLYSAAVLGDSLGEELREKAYVTFVAGIFRSVRFGTTSAHGVANAIAFNWLVENGGVTTDAAGKYQADLKLFVPAMEGLLTELLTIQHMGDYDRAQSFIETFGSLPEELVMKLEALSSVPVDIEFIWKD